MKTESPRPDSKTEPKTDVKTDMKTETSKAETSKADVGRPDPGKTDARRAAGAVADRGVVRQDVPLSELQPDPENRTVDETDEEFVTLTDSVRVMGILVALQVHRRLDGKLQIWDGERRWRAAQRASLASVPCDVWPDSTHPRDLALAGVVVNEQRQAHSSLAVARRLRAVKNQFGETHEQVAARTGLPLPRVKAYLNLFNASDRLLAFFEETNLPLKTAVEIVRYEKMAGEVAARRLLDRHTDEPLTARGVEILRKRVETRKREDAPAPAAKPASRGGPSSLASKVEAAFKKDPQGARAELEAVGAKLGFRLVAGTASSLPGA